MDLNRSPSAIAFAAEQEVRALNHATLGKDAFQQPADIYAVAESLATLIDRLPQALTQISATVQRFEEQQAIRMDDGSDPGERVSTVLRALLDAQQGLAVAQDGMRRAKSPLAGMGGYWDPADEEDGAIR